MFHRMLSRDKVSTSLSTLQRRLKSAKYSRKRLSTKILGQVGNDAIARYNSRLKRVTESGPLVVSVDECNFSEKVTPLYGYSQIGQKCRIRNKKGGWVSYSLVLCIASDGTKYHNLKKGSVNRAEFATVVRNMPFPAGSVLILDNCKIHSGIEEAYASKGYVPMFLSPYSPQFQPVELAFSKVKGHFRQLWPWDEGVTNSIDQSVATLTGQDIRNFFKHADECLSAKMAEISSWSTLPVPN